MTERDKIQHQLPNGDVLIQDTNRTRPEVEQVFAKVEQDAAQRARLAFAALKQPA